MAFKSVDQFNEDRYRCLFRLVNDGDYADVVFLYRSRADELIADAHYIKSASYSGYVHCCGRGCPACAKGIKVQSKLFIPVFVATQNGMPLPPERNPFQFWDRSVKFDTQLAEDVFNKYPNPSEYVFRITRQGVANDIDTKYDIQVVARNTTATYDTLLAQNNIQMPDYYSEIIREVSSSELAGMLQNAGPAKDLPEFTPIPRAGYQPSIPNTYVNAAEAVSAPVPSPVPDLPEANIVSATASPISDTDVIADTDSADASDDEEFPEPEF